MKAKAVIRLKFPSEGHLKIITEALMPEVKKPATTRSKVNLETNRRFLILNVEARDTVALRAALNAYLRWINSTIEVLESIGKIKQVCKLPLTISRKSIMLQEKTTKKHNRH